MMSRRIQNDWENLMNKNNIVNSNNMGIVKTAFRSISGDSEEL